MFLSKTHDFNNLYTLLYDSRKFRLEETSFILKAVVLRLLMFSKYVVICFLIDWFFLGKSVKLVGLIMQIEY